MALLWFDGFETYNNENPCNDAKVIRVPGITITNSVVSQTYGRRNSQSVYGFNSDMGLWYTFDNTYSTFIVGVAIRRSESGTPVFNSSYPLFNFLDGSTSQVKIMLEGNEIIAYRGDDSQLGSTSGLGSFINNVWYFVEVKVTFHNSSGIVVVRVDGNVVLNLSSQDTQNSSNAYANVIKLHPVSNNLDTNWDDLYICDTSGSKNNDFLGDIRIDAIRPDSAGTYSQFTPSAGSNYQNVDESTGPDDDSTYNDGTTPGNKDSYNLGSMPGAALAIHGIKSQITVKKTDAGSKNIKILTKSGSTEDLSPSTSLSDTYTTPARILEDNPDDSQAWEEADVNALEVGIQIVTTTTSTTTTTTTTA